MAKKKEKAESKEPKKKGRKVQIDPTYLHDLCVEIYTEELDKEDLYNKRRGKMASERLLEDYVKDYKGDEEKALKRFREHAQIYAPITRTVLRMLKNRGELPKAAEPKG